MAPLLTIAFLILAVVVANLFTRLKVLEQRSRLLEDLLSSSEVANLAEAETKLEVDTSSEAKPETEASTLPANDQAKDRSVAKIVSGSDNEAAEIFDAPREIHETQKDWQQSNPIRQFSFEDLVGGKLPIWVGGIALIFAGFFMVRYSIDAGLFGPTQRIISAAFFGFLLIGLSAFGRKIPRIGHVFAEDDRIGQSLAGAGIAILYATLYMASELYRLIGIEAAFPLVIAVTVLAFFLALRHGPPNAIMGMVGGFVAPWVANMGPDNMPTLLAYLAVFICSVFGISIWQRWLWLLLLATGGGALWTIALVISADSGLPLLGLFITLICIAATFSALRLNGGSKRFNMVAIYAPLALAMLQIAVLVPRMEFTATGWLFLAALGVLSIVLAWRGDRLRPLSYIAAVISIFPIINGWFTTDNNALMAAITAGYVMLYSGTGLLRIWIDKSHNGWTILTIFPPLITAVPFIGQNDLLSNAGWAGVALLAAIPAAISAWLYRDEENNMRPISFAAASVVGLFAITAALLLLPDKLAPLIFVIAGGLVAAWATFIGATTVRRLSHVLLAFGVLAALAMAYDLVEPMLGTLAGDFAIFEYLPTIGEAAIETLLPAMLLIAIALHPRFGLGRVARLVTVISGGVGLGIFLWLLSRHIFSISTPADFIQFGFAERMILTLSIACAGAAAIWQGGRGDAQMWSRTGIILLAIAAVRLTLFDLMLFNPVVRAQAIGPAPIANMATILCAAVAALFWFASKAPTSKNSPDGDNDNIVRHILFGLSLGAAALTALVTVRQLIHGNIIANAPVTTNENYLYSALLLLLSMAWLARGITTSVGLLRIAGLSLLTIVTVKVFVIDAAALGGVLRILSFLGLGIALMGIGWAYGRLMRGRDLDEEETPAA